PGDAAATAGSWTPFAASSDGMMFAYKSNADPSGANNTVSFPSIWVVDFWEGRARAVADNPLWTSTWPPLSWAAFSPDGTKIGVVAYASGTHNLFAVGLDGA